MSDSHSLDYVFRTHDNQLLCVTAPEPFSYKGFRIFIGNESEPMRNIPVKGSIMRYRDGGTTLINTDEGLLFAPTVFRDDAATFGIDREYRDAAESFPENFRLETLPCKDYSFEESEAGFILKQAPASTTVFRG